MIVELWYIYFDMAKLFVKLGKSLVFLNMI